MSNPSKKLSNPFSTGGGGTHFESHVQAAFVVLMLTNGHPPCLPNKRISKIQLQAKVDGFNLDDMVVFLEDIDSKEEHRLLTQIKHSITISSENKIFQEVISAAWSDFRNPRNFSKSKDRMALITGPISANDIYNVRTILDWACTPGQNYAKYFEYIGKDKFSSATKKQKLKAFSKALEVANGTTPLSQEEFFEFLKHFNLIGYDLDIKNGVTHSLLASHIAQYYPSDVPAVWSQVVTYVQDISKSSGTISLEDIPEEIKKYFREVKVNRIPTEFVKAEPTGTLSVTSANPTALLIANLLGSWAESNPADTEIVRRLVDGV